MNIVSSIKEFLKRKIFDFRNRKLYRDIKKAIRTYEQDESLRKQIQKIMNDNGF